MILPLRALLGVSLSQTASRSILGTRVAGRPASTAGEHRTADLFEALKNGSNGVMIELFTPRING